MRSPRPRLALEGASRKHGSLPAAAKGRTLAGISGPCGKQKSDNFHITLKTKALPCLFRRHRRQIQEFFKPPVASVYAKRGSSGLAQEGSQNVARGSATANRRP